MQIQRAATDEEVRGCYPVMRQLRPEVDEPLFLARVRAQRQQRGFELAFARDEDQVRAVAGYYTCECLAWRKYLYVNDLVTHADFRGRGYGGALLDWLVAQARAQGCDEFHLDSGVQRFDAHRFYLGKGLNIASHHFSMMLSPKP